MILSKHWEAGAREHLSAKGFDELSEEDQSDFRTSFKLSLPAVGTILSLSRHDDTWRPGGGYVFQQVHNIMADVPPENIVAMYRAVNGA